MRRDAGVALSGAGLPFPGWDDGTLDRLVDPSDSSVRIEHRAYFNPLRRARFVVSAHVRPRDSTQSSSPLTSNDTPNIAQKGLRTSPGGQWKLSVFGDLRPSCTFRGRDDGDPGTDTVQRVVSGRPAQALRAGTDYRMECELRRRAVALRVYRVRTSDEVLVVRKTATYPPGKFVIDNHADVWIDKKPFDTTAGDTFAGVVDEVTIRRFHS